MSTAAPQALDRRSVPWLFVAGLVTTLPHVENQAYWLSGVLAVIFAWGAWLWWRGTRLPNRWMIALVVAGFTGCILVEYRTLFGRDAGVAMLVGFMALKMLELKSRRDAHVVVILGYFLLLTHYLFSQSIPTGLWLLASCVVLTSTLVRLSGGAASGVVDSLRYGGFLTLQAIPFMLVLYLLFPRISGPLWGLPQDAHKSTSGLSETMSPGSIAEIALSSAIAFRAQFKDAPPAHDQLYWRGPVMEIYDGVSWRTAPPNNAPSPRIEARGTPVRYTVTIEPSNQPWLLALDAPVELPPETRLAPTLTLLANKPIQERTRFEITSSPGFRFNELESPQQFYRALQLPSKRNPKTLALARQWRAEDANPEHLIARALKHFGSEPFAYTLRPPLLGPDAMDDFLFETRRGFCEHYAAAFVILMRAAGIPARVIGGYQGGELNPLDGYMVVRQSDAHAWAEVWLDGKGWTRVDPTAAISPARIESGIANALPENEPLPALVQIQSEWVRNLRFRWEAINNTWNQWVLGYNPARQRELLSRLGLPDPDWRSLGALMAGAFVVIMLAITAWTLYQRPRIDAARLQWDKALRKLRRHRIDADTWEAPLALAARIEREHPLMGPKFREVAQHYCAVRYGDAASTITALKAAVAALP